MYPFTDGMCTNWKFGSSAYKFYFNVYPSKSSYLNDDESLVKNLNLKDHYLVSEKKNHIFRADLTSNTSYYLCAVAYDKDGNRGPIFKKLFTTKKTTDPIAEITSITYDNYNYKWYAYITMKNGAAKFYCTYHHTSSYSHRHFEAWKVYHDIKVGNLYSTYTSSPLSFILNEDDVWMITVAVNYYGTLGNCDVWKASRTKSSGAKPVLKKDNGLDNVDCMKISELKNNKSAPIDEGFYVKRP